MSSYSSPTWTLMSIIVRAENPAEALQYVISRGVTGDVLRSLPATKQAADYNVEAILFERLQRGLKERGRLPTLSEIEEEYPVLEEEDFQRHYTVDDLQHYCQIILEMHAFTLIDRAITKFEGNRAGRLVSAFNELQLALGKVSTGVAVDKDLYGDRVSAETIVSMFQGGTSAAGIEWPWQQVTEQVGPMLPGQFILGFGKTNVGKSWFGLLLAATAMRAGKRVVVYSAEMSKQQLHKRILGILSMAKFSDAVRGVTSDTDVIKVLDANKEYGHLLTVTDASDTTVAVGGPAQIKQRIKTNKADLVILDSAYSLQVPGVRAGEGMTPQSLSAMIVMLKQMALDENVAIVATLQENISKANQSSGKSALGNVHGSSAAIHQADTAIRLVGRPSLGELSLEFLKRRDWYVDNMRDGLTVGFKHCQDYSFRGWHIHDVNAEEKEQEKEEKETAQLAEKIFKSANADAMRAQAQKQVAPAPTHRFAKAPTIKVLEG